MIAAEYVGKLETVTIPQKISVASLTLKKLDAAFAQLDGLPLEVVTIKEESKAFLFGSRDSSPDRYSFTSLSKSSGRSHLTLHCL